MPNSPEQPPPRLLVYWLFFSSFTFLVAKFFEIFYARPSQLEELCALIKNRLETFSLKDYHALVSLLQKSSGS